MNNRYETVFILTPVLSEAQVKEAVKQHKDWLKKRKATVLHEEDWGLKKLAYPIQKKSTGFYHLIEFEAPTDSIQPLEVEMKRDERILRFLTLKMDKHAIAFSEGKR